MARETTINVSSGAVKPVPILGGLNIFVDPFNRAAGSLGANYTDYINGISIHGGTPLNPAYGNNNSNYNLTAFTATSTGPTQNATAVVNPNVLGYVGPAVRISGTPGSTANCYWCGENNTTLYLVKETGLTPSSSPGNVVLLSVPITAAQIAAGPFAITQVGVVGGTVTYTGTITGGAANAFAGFVFAMSGFTNGVNNITITVTSSTATTLVATTVAQVNETATAIATQIPASVDTINLKVVGNTLSAYWNRTGATLQYNDNSSPFTTGVPGLIMNNNVAFLDSFTMRNAVVPTGTKVQVVCDGDSITEGAGIFSPWTDYLTFPSGSNPYVTNVAVSGKAMSIGLPAGGVNGAGGAGTIETMLATGTSVVDALYVSGIKNVVVICAGTNDLSNGVSVSATYTALTTYIANRHAAGWKVVVMPVLSCHIYDTLHQALNTLILANSAGADAVVSLPPSLTATGAYSNTAFFSDGIHPTQSAVITIIAPAVSAAIGTL